MAQPSTTRDVLLRRAGLVFLEPRGVPASADLVRAVSLELAAVGHVPTVRLEAALARLGITELAALRTWACGVLAAAVGADRKHEPLFRSFPDGIPDDTEALYWQKVLIHFLQAEGQPCLFCRRTGTTHVLDPCRHVVCDQCFDGASYSACPACEHHVDRSSPFFQPAPERGPPNERVTFKLLDLGDELDAATRTLVAGFCARKQALSPTDRDDFATILRDQRERVLPWLPEQIPLKENIALVFGTIFQHIDPMTVVPVARRYLATATDVLRLIVAYSGADPSLQKITRYAEVTRLVQPSRWWGKLVQVFTGADATPYARAVRIPVRTFRFPVARLRRPLRRALLAILDGLHPDRLAEDMLRHRSSWVWVGEFLHPHEYASRYPTVARAFQIVRGQAPDGTPAPAFTTWYGKVEAAARAGDATAMADVLRERPGELARRLDHALRIAGDDPRAVAHVTAAFTAVAPSCATPVLLTLRSLLPTRTRPAPVRLFWPKGEVSKGVSSPDQRRPLPADAIAPAVRAADAELLRRFAAKPGFDDVIVDAALRRIVVPFNERTASRAAVALPRGSQVAVPAGKLVRLFVHWCEPEKGGQTTDVDLSVGFYDEAWQYRSVCSYYQLTCNDQDGRVMARSGGDLRSAPFPDGATELVDVHRDIALASGVRYAVMVVNNYAGLPFALLERGFAGVMLRDDPDGLHVDARTVELKFELQGDNGVYLPLVLDLRDDTLHWLDVHANGGMQFNNVATSNKDIQRLCPEMMAYFASGQRASMYDLALLHAAARARRVWVRGDDVRRFDREAGEDPAAFLTRLTGGAGAPATLPPAGQLGTTFAALLRGDLDLPAGSTCYALFRDRITAPIAAADLLS